MPHEPRRLSHATRQQLIRFALIQTVQSRDRRYTCIYYPVTRVSDANYVEYLPVDCANRFACPGTNLLALVAKVKQLAAQRGVPLPPTPFVVEATLQPLSSDRVSKLIKNLMTAAGWLDARSHDLRAASNAALQALGVPTDDVCTRGGWSSAINATRIDHYSSFRFVSRNFAQLLLGGDRVVPVVEGEVVE